jgi:hypothetical protein
VARGLPGRVSLILGPTHPASPLFPTYFGIPPARAIVWGFTLFLDLYILLLTKPQTAGIH